ncbi:MAG: hypothetical protein RQ885_00625 [Desulfurococcales archaeon]|nr:hypothetical protein [Desulfurococcales archaeon]
MMNDILVPRINSVSLWPVDDHVWKPVNPTKININSSENTSSRVSLLIPIGIGYI